MVRRLNAWRAMRKLRMRQAQLMKMARDAQRGGDIEKYAQLVSEAEAVAVQIRATEPVTISA